MMISEVAGKKACFTAVEWSWVMASNECDSEAITDILQRKVRRDEVLSAKGFPHPATQSVLKIRFVAMNSAEFRGDRYGNFQMTLEGRADDMLAAAGHHSVLVNHRAEKSLLS